eukprot:15150825-Heterocapsa_arctica.AAC.1
MSRRCRAYSRAARSGKKMFRTRTSSILLLAPSSSTVSSSKSRMSMSPPGCRCHPRKASDLCPVSHSCVPVGRACVLDSDQVADLDVLLVASVAQTQRGPAARR